MRGLLATAILLGALMASPARAATFVYVGNAESKPSAADLHITPDGKFLYASERTSSTLAGFKVDPTSGMLSAIGSVPTEKQPRGFNIDASGRYVLAVGQLSHALSSYRIDPDSGKLIKLKEYPMGKNPNWVEIVDLP